MDFFVKHWAPFPRRFPAPFPLVNADFARRKDHWVRASFETCNFSLILRGRGEFHRQGKTWTIEAPCVLTQWPGEPVEYGPPVPAETWDELYLIYDARQLARFRQRRLIDPERPVWPIADLPAVMAQIAEFHRLAQSRHPEAVVDRVDRVCERMIMETHLSTHFPPPPDEREQEQPPGETSEREKMRGILRAMTEEVMEEIRGNLGGQTAPVRPKKEPLLSFTASADFERLAARHGMSLSTFRRRWAEAGQPPPARWLQQLRLREACRLLVETARPIREIAHAVGFGDELYFSRRFHKEQQMPPRDYRKAYRIPKG